MNNKVKATLLGIAASLIGVAIWIALSFAGIIAGIAGAIMGFAFIKVYQHFNSEDKSNYPYIVGSIVIIIEIVISEFITLFIVAMQEDVAFADCLSIDGIPRIIATDIIVGLLLSALVFGGIIYAMKKQEKNLKPDSNRVVAELNPSKDDNELEEVSEKENLEEEKGE